MGTYLMKPETEKFSNDQENDKLKYGASSMQGWRESQEVRNVFSKWPIHTLDNHVF